MQGGEKFDVANCYPRVRTFGYQLRRHGVVVRCRRDEPGEMASAYFRRVTLRSLDAIIKVSFACIMIAILIPELGGHSGEPVQVFVMLAGFVGVAAAGFWRARLVRLDQSSRAAPPRQSVGIPVDEPGASQAQNRLRDLGLIAFLVGLFVLLVSFAILFSAPPQPRLATAGGILTALGAAGLAFRYRFFAVLVACFLADRRDRGVRCMATDLLGLSCGADRVVARASVAPGSSSPIQRLNLNRAGRDRGDSVSG